MSLLLRRLVQKRRAESLYPRPSHRAWGEGDGGIVLRAVTDACGHMTTHLFPLISTLRARVSCHGSEVTELGFGIGGCWDNAAIQTIQPPPPKFHSPFSWNSFTEA